MQYVFAQRKNLKLNLCVIIIIMSSMREKLLPFPKKVEREEKHFSEINEEDRKILRLFFFLEIFNLPFWNIFE